MRSVGVQQTVLSASGMIGPPVFAATVSVGSWSAAFALAALGARRAAWAEIRATLGQNWREPRAYLAAAVTMGVSANFLVRTVSKRGRGI